MKKKEQNESFYIRLPHAMVKVLESEAKFLGISKPTLASYLILKGLNLRQKEKEAQFQLFQQERKTL